MVSQGSSLDSDGVPVFMQNTVNPSSPEGGFSSPDSAAGVGVYAKHGPALQEGFIESSSGGIPVEISVESTFSEHTPTPAEAVLACMLEDTAVSRVVSPVRMGARVLPRRGVPVLQFANPSIVQGVDVYKCLAGSANQLVQEVWWRRLTQIQMRRVYSS